ncbi:MAG: tetratricopeptide repeat protein [Candidatus Kapaibacterium sp.]
MIGRSEQLTEILENIEVACTRGAMQNVLFLTGEAGIGKSTLIKAIRDTCPEYFANKPQVRTPAIVVSECSTPLANQDIGEVEALKPWIDLMEQLVLMTTREPEQEKKEKKIKFDFGKFIIDTAPNWISLVPVLGPVVGAAAEIVTKSYDQLYLHKQFEKERPSSALATVGSQDQLFQQYINFLAKFSDVTPLVLIMDDFHWADTSSSNLLFAAARQLLGKPITFIVAYRPDDANSSRDGAGHPILHIRNELGRYSMFSEITVPRMTALDLDALLRTRYENYVNNDEFEEWLAKVSGGNALFITQFLHTLEEDGIVSAKNGKFQNQYENVRVPKSAYAVVQERIRRLSEEAKELLRYASVEGDTFTAFVLSKITEVPTLKILQKLRIIEDTHRVVRSLGKQKYYAHESTAYQFVHVLLQRAMYESLEEEERELLHEAIFYVLKEEWDSASEAGVNVQSIAPRLATHANILGEYEFAAMVLLAGAQSAWQGFAEDESMRMLQGVDYYLGMMKHQSPAQSNRTKQTGGGQPDVLLAEAMMLRGNIHKTRGRYDLAQKEFYNARVLFGKLHKTERMLDAMVREAFVIENKGNYKQAETRSKETLVLAEQFNYPKAQGAMLNNIGLAKLALGKADEALDYQMRSLKIREETNDLKGQAATLGSIGIIFQKIGKADEALTYHRRALEIRQMLGNRAQEAYSYRNIGEILAETNKWDEGLGYLNQSLEIYKNIGVRSGEANALFSIGLAHYFSKNYAAALEYFAHSLDIFEQIGNQAGECASLDNLGATQRLLGRLPEARASLEKGLAIAQEIGAKQTEAEICGDLGLLSIDEAKNSLFVASEKKSEAVRLINRCISLYTDLKHPEAKRWETVLQEIQQ